MMVPTDADYLKRLTSLASRVSPERIMFHKPVQPQEINRKLIQFDVGIPLIRANTLSYLNALPNKFFEYVMAGLGIVVSPLPSMQKIIEEHAIGIIAGDQSMEGMAAALNDLTAERINRFKQNSLELAQILNAEREMEKLMGIYGELLK